MNIRFACSLFQCEQTFNGYVTQVVSQSKENSPIDWRFALNMNIERQPYTYSILIAFHFFFQRRSEYHMNVNGNGI